MKNLWVLAVASQIAMAPLMAAQQGSSDITGRLTALWPATVASALPPSAGTAPQGPAGADTLPSTVATNLAWTRDGRGFFYTSTPHPTQLYYHWTRKHQPDLLVYESPDGAGATVRGDMSSEGEYVIITATHPTDTHTRLLMVDLDDADHPTVSAPVIKLYDDFDAAYHFVGSYGNTLYILTDRDAPRGKILSLDATDPRRANERQALAEGAQPLIYAHSVATRLFAVYRDVGNAHDVVRVLSLQGFQIGTVPLPTFPSVSQIAWGGRQDKDTAYIVAQSLLSPPTVYGYALRSAQTIVARAPAVPVDSTPFQLQMVHYDSTGASGLTSPYTAYVAARKGLTTDGSHRVWIDSSATSNGAGLHFTPAAIVWIEQGGVYIATGTNTPAARKGVTQWAVAQHYGTTETVIVDAEPSLSAGVDATATWLTQRLH